MEEIFKDIPGYEGLYQASNLGNIKSLSRNIIRNNGEIHPLLGKILKLKVEKSGYLRITLCRSNYKTSYSVHRLVVLAFILNPENKPQVNHINGIKDDNKLENLQWRTRSENQKHRFTQKYISD